MSDCQTTKSPRPWSGKMVWDGRDLFDKHSWITRLEDADIRQILSAVDKVRVSKKPLIELTADDLKLDDFELRLIKLRDEILNGRGFAVLSGLPPNLSDKELMVIYWVIGSWIGNPVPQNASAHLLGHVIDQRRGASPGTRIYQTNRAQPFHSDSCDIVGLLCLRQAKSGGQSSIASSAAIHNQLLDKNPAALNQLYQSFQCDRYGEIPEGKLPFYDVQVYNEVDGNLVCCGMDPDIRSAQRLKAVTQLTEHQVQALDAFQETASSVALSMSLQRGDIQLVNNHTVVHAREQFEDFKQQERRRYLVRLWLSSPIGRKLPEFLAERWGNIDVGSIRGGILVKGKQPVITFDPSL